MKLKHLIFLAAFVGGTALAHDHQAASAAQPCPMHKPLSTA